MPALPSQVTKCWEGQPIVHLIHDARIGVEKGRRIRNLPRLVLSMAAQKHVDLHHAINPNASRNILAQLQHRQRAPASGSGDHTEPPCGKNTYTIEDARACAWACHIP